MALSTGGARRGEWGGSLDAPEMEKGRRHIRASKGNVPVWGESGGKAERRKEVDSKKKVISGVENSRKKKDSNVSCLPCGVLSNQTSGKKLG